MTNGKALCWHQCEAFARQTCPNEASSILKWRYIKHPGCCGQQRVAIHGMLGSSPSREEADAETKA